MDKIEKILLKMRRSPSVVSFGELYKVCCHFFGVPRQAGGSHRVFKMPWRGDPRVNIQNDKGKAKLYQIKQVLQAIDKLSRGSHD